MISKNKLYELGKRIGLNKKEVDDIIQPVSDVQPTKPKKLSLQNLTDEYMPGTTYGTISINDFQ